MTTKERIGLALERSDKSQRDLAKYMGVSSPTVSSMLAKDDIDSIKYLRAVEELTGYRFEWLRTGAAPERLEEAANIAEDPNLAYWKNILNTKEQLIEEMRDRISIMKKYVDLLEEKLNGTKK